MPSEEGKVKHLVVKTGTSIQNGIKPDITLLNYGSNSTEFLLFSQCRYLFLLFFPRCHLSGQYLRNTPQPCRLDKPTRKKPLTVLSFSSGSFLARTLSHSLFRSSILYVLILPTKRRCLLMPSSPFPRAPGMAFAFSPKHSPCAKRFWLEPCVPSQELHRSEVRPGWATSCRGADSAQVSPDAGGQSWIPRAASPSAPAGPACGGGVVAAGGASGEQLKRWRQWENFLLTVKLKMIVT